VLLEERLRGTRVRIAQMDAGRPLEEQVGEAEALVPSMGRVTRSVIAAAPRLKLIAQFGAGLEGVDLEAARERGIPVRNVAGVNAQAVAELAVFLMLGLARKVRLHPRSFERRVVGDPPGTELSGKTLGIVGLGAGGQALTRIARGFGMDVIGVRRHPAPQPELSWVGGPEGLDELLRRSDYVTLLVPLSAETRGMIDARRLALMKPTACLINVGRGALVEREALLAALRERRLAGAGLDVYWEEPPDPADPLFGLDNVVATPHLGGVSDEALARIADRLAATLIEFLDPSSAAPA
jgi:phosphoglycerate dehydrogenase-like enzyme